MDLENVLKHCSLWHLFPEKIHREDLFAVFSGKNDGESNLGEELEVPFHKLEFLQKIVFFNETCRMSNHQEVKPKTSGLRARRRKSFSPKTEMKSYALHPLDISTAVFLCCDHIARQDLVLHFWGCKHGFPLVVKSEQLEPPVLFIWSLRNLIVKYTLPKGDDTIEKPVTNFNFKVISAMRFSEQPVSKSNLLNKLINKSDKEHAIFFHRDLEGSTRLHAEISDGLVEAMPVFDSTDKPSIYLNLRGNSDLHPVQKSFLTMTSDIIILLVSLQEIEKVKTLITKYYLCTCQTVILVISDLSTSDQDVLFAEQIEDFFKKHNINPFIVALKGIGQFDSLKEIWSEIEHCDGEHKLEEWLKFAEECHLHVDQTDIDNTIENATAFTSNIISQFQRNRMYGVLPLQGTFSLEWSKLDLETHKLKHWNKKDSVKIYREILERKKKECRLEQIKMIKTEKCKSVYDFINGFAKCNKTRNEHRFESYISVSRKESELFLRTVKLNFENETRETLNNVYKKYRKLMGQIPIDQNNATYITQKLEQLDKTFNENSITISDFAREMGQMFEVNAYRHFNENEISTLPMEAVKLLLYGYQIELIDGRSNYVSINWIQSVFSELQKYIGNIRLKVITVLGVQSSGKSTLLNIMFGSQFAVGAGRCTRGAYMHLVKVSPDSRHIYKVDYVLVVDTEGLFSTSANLNELEERDRRERELATFIIGISNITIVNIFGENLTYLKDILPISVHAFLRMDLAGLHPKCKLVHQHVPKINLDLLLPQTHRLEIVLDEYTDAACSIENVPKRLFKEIIQFDISKDVVYFPSIFEYHNSQEKISTAFSVACATLKEQLMEDVDAVTSLEDLIPHVGYLWNAIKKENFVYDFKNTIETKARLFLDKRYCKLHVQIRCQFQTNLNKYKAKVLNCNTLEEFSCIKSKYKNDVRQMINKLVADYRYEIGLPIESRILEHACQHFRDSTIRASIRAIEESKNEFDSQMNRLLKYKKKEIEILKGNEMILRTIETYIDTRLEESLSPDYNAGIIIKDLFDSWLRGAHDVKDIVIADLNDAAVDCIYTYFPTHRVKVDEILDKQDIEKANMQIFLKDVPCTFWQNYDGFQRERELVQSVIHDLYNYLQKLYHDISCGKNVFEASVFQDIVLKVRTNRVINYEIHVKPSFEIELSVNLCGELIQWLKHSPKKIPFVERHFVMNAENYFISKCREKMGYRTNALQFSETVVKIILSELEQYLIENLCLEIADFLRSQTVYLCSKQSLIIGLYLYILENDATDLLKIYLFSFESGIRSWISWLFDSITEDQTIKIVIEKHIAKSIEFISEQLLKQNEMLKENENDKPSTEVRHCILEIKAALDSVVPLYQLGQLENDITEEIETSSLIQMVIVELKTEKVKTHLLKAITYRVLETEEYDNIKYETVRCIVSDLLGCRSTCPSCGEVCCIGLDIHKDIHKPLMHRPVGFNFGQKRMLYSETCWDEISKLLEPKSNEEVIYIRTNAHNWSFTSDCSVEDNSFWKYMFAKHGAEIAQHFRIQLSNDIPQSWTELDKAEEIMKLRKALIIKIWRYKMEIYYQLIFL